MEKHYSYKSHLFDFDKPESTRLKESQGTENKKLQSWLLINSVDVQLDRFSFSCGCGLSLWRECSFHASLIAHFQMHALQDLCTIILLLSKQANLN